MFRIGTVLTTTLLFLVSPAWAREATAPAHLTWARLLVEEIKPRHNEYVHKVDLVRWKGKGAPFAECRTDCSGLVNALLRQAHGTTRKNLKGWLGVERPQAKHYHEAIVAKNGFVSVARMEDVRPGDVLAIRYPPGRPNTGHVMIVDEVPVERDASRPLRSGTKQWGVKVIDCSRSGHGTKDTRHKAGGGHYSGVGRGTFRIYTDTASGRIVGYCWSNSAKSTFTNMREGNLVVGRLRLP